MDQIVCLNPGSRVILFRSDSGGFARRTRTMGPAFRAARSHRTQAMRSNRGVWNSRTTPPCASRTRPSTRGYTGRNSGSPASAVSCRAAVGGGCKRSGRQSRRNARSGSCPPSSCPARLPRTVGGQDDRLCPAAQWPRIVWRTSPVYAPARASASGARTARSGTAYLKTPFEDIRRSVLNGVVRGPTGVLGRRTPLTETRDERDGQT